MASLSYSGNMMSRGHEQVKLPSTTVRVSYLCFYFRICLQMYFNKNEVWKGTLNPILYILYQGGSQISISIGNSFLPNAIPYHLSAQTPAPLAYHSHHDL